MVVCQDFAENFKCHFQDEAQGAHWVYAQVTLHTSVASYRCTFQNCTQMTSEAIIFVSDDNKHDCHAVHHFNCIMMQHLKEQQAIPVQKVMHFSDGTPVQYKNKTAFADLSCAEEDFGVATERHFFGKRHGNIWCNHCVHKTSHVPTLQQYQSYSWFCVIYGLWFTVLSFCCADNYSTSSAATGGRWPTPWRCHDMKWEWRGNIFHVQGINQSNG